MKIEEYMLEPRFGFMGEDDRNFVIAMTSGLEKRGYTFGDTVSDGVCWGKYMLIFTKAGTKSKNVAARIYIRENSVALRLFLHDVSKHEKYIISAPEHIREVFTGSRGACSHCRGAECRFRKSYEIGGVKFDKCNGLTFTFENASEDKVPDYIALFCEFYPASRRRATPQT